MLERHNFHTFKPITLEYRGQERDIGSVEAAAEALLSEWPDDDGDRFYEAVKACLDCIHEQAEPEFARLAFLRAAFEAGIRIHH